MYFRESKPKFLFPNSFSTMAEITPTTVSLWKLGLGDISNICDVSRDVLQGMYKMPLSRTSNTNWHAMFLFAAAGILVVLELKYFNFDANFA